MKEVTQLFAGARTDGSPAYEEVVVERLGTGRFKVMQSPGLVLGVAAGDVIDVSEDRRATVVERGGNLCIQIYTKGEGAQIEPIVRERLEPLNGRLDGRSEQQLVFTVPASAGLAVVESAMTEVVRQFPKAEWYYGNVYDPVDGVTPLNWWLQ